MGCKRDKARLWAQKSPELAGLERVEWAGTDLRLYLAFQEFLLASMLASMG